MAATTFDGRTFKRHKKSAQYVYWKCMRKGCTAELRTLRDLSRKRLLCAHTGRCHRPGEIQPQPATPTKATEAKASSAVTLEVSLADCSQMVAAQQMTVSTTDKNNNKSINCADNSAREKSPRKHKQEAEQRPPKRLASMSGAKQSVSWQEQCDFGRAVLLSLVASPNKQTGTEQVTPTQSSANTPAHNTVSGSALSKHNTVSGSALSKHNTVSGSALSKHNTVSGSALSKHKHSHSPSQRGSPVKKQPSKPAASLKATVSQPRDRRSARNGHAQKKDRGAPRSTGTGTMSTTCTPAAPNVPSTKDFMHYVMLSALADHCMPPRLNHLRHFVQQPVKLL